MSSRKRRRLAANDATPPSGAAPTGNAATAGGVSATTVEPAASTRDRRIKVGLSVALLLLAAVLMFVGLGDHSLWDDEANTALFGQGVWETGDTTGVRGDNVVAYRNGVELDEHLMNRLTAPLGYFVVAPFVGLFGASPRAVRFPFALAGLLTVALGLFWLWRTQAPLKRFILVALAGSGSVAFFLYCRQGRYYAFASLMTLLVMFLYVRRDGSWQKTLGLGAAGVCLFAAHYLAFFSVAAAVGVDYLAWGRRERPLPLRRLAALAGLLGVCCGTLLSIWYPLGKEIAGQYSAEMSWFAARRALLFLNLRDLNAAELGVGAFCLLAPVLYFARGRRHPVLLRLPLALLVAVTAVSIFTPQPGNAEMADVRYMAHLVPAFILLGVEALLALPVPAWATGGLAVLGFHTTLLTIPLAWLMNGPVPPVRSTLFELVRELNTPTEDPYGVAAAWLRDHAEPGASAWVTPDFATYPLMFHAPHVVYAWQFAPEYKKKFSTLPPIHFQGAALPRLIVAFDGKNQEAQQVVAQLASQGASYARREVLSEYAVIGYRPEVFWHRFRPEPPGFDPERHGIVIYERTR